MAKIFHNIMKPVDQAGDKLSQTTRPKNILFMVPGFPADAQDSTCIPALQQYAYHASRRPEVKITVVAFQYPFTQGRYDWQGIPVYACGGAGRGGWRRLRTWLRAVVYFLRIHRREKVSTIHSFWLSECALLGQLLAGLLRIRHVASIMGQDAQAGNRYLKWFRWRRMTITAPSEFAAKTFQESTGQAAPQIIPIGLAEDDRPEAAAQRDIDILGVGALTALKHYRLFIELVDRLRPEFPELRGVIIGEGPEREALEAQIAGKGLQAHIRLSGQLSRPEVLAQMARSRILLHPSSYESQGYVLMEALYCGMAVVCLPVGYTVPSERMRVCRDAAEMGRELADLLRQHLPPQSLLLKPIAETVNAFQELYR